MSTHPLYLGVELPHRVELPVLGVSVVFRANAPALVEEALATFGAWRAYTGPRDRREQPVVVDLVLHDAPPEGDDFTCRIPDHERVLLMGRGSLGISDAARMGVTAYVSAALLATPDVFRYEFLKGQVLALLAHADRFPLHAGAVARGDTALLLMGPSGTGKSTLAYAWMRSGGAVLSDDAVYVQRRAPGGVWGMPTQLHLLPDTIRHFPELADEPVTLQLTGKAKIPRPARAPADRSGRFVYHRFGLCFLEPASADAAPESDPLDPGEVAAELRRRPEERLDTWAPEAPALLSALAHRGAWRLRLGGAPQDALPAIEKMLAALDESR